MRAHLFEDGHACGKIRILMPAEQLRERGGHQITTSFGWGVAPRNEEAMAAELLVAQRISSAEGTGLWRRLKPGRKLVYEIDDDLWNIDRTNYKAFASHGAGTRDAVETSIGISDLVTVSTHPLADVVRKWNSNVAVLPNHIDARMMDLATPRVPGKVVVGWQGGDSHVRDLAIVIPTLKRLINQNPNVELHTIGTDFLSMFKVRGRHTGWQVELMDLYRKMDFDIAIAPLVDSVFNRSKSAIKALEAMALGIPIIASDLEPYRGIVEHGVNGFLVRRKHEWMGYLRTLVADAGLRERMGREGRRTAAAMTIQTGWRKWELAYALTLAGKTPDEFTAEVVRGVMRSTRK